MYRGCNKKGLQRIHFEVFKWLLPQLLSLWLVSDLIMTEIFVKMMKILNFSMLFLLYFWLVFRRGSTEYDLDNLVAGPGPG